MFGAFELGAMIDPLNLYSRSNGNNSTYNIPIENGKNMLTNQLDDKFFSLEELEIWEII